MAGVFVLVFVFKTHPTLTLAIPRHLSKRIKTDAHEMTSTQVYTAALFVLAQTGKNPNTYLNDNEKTKCYILSLQQLKKNIIIT